jgi:hypothetical protein
LLSEPLRREESHVALKAMFPATGSCEPSEVLLQKARDTLGGAQFWLTAPTTEGQGVIRSMRSLIREIEAHLGLGVDDQLVMADA